MKPPLVLGLMRILLVGLLLLLLVAQPVHANDYGVASVHRAATSLPRQEQKPNYWGKGNIASWLGNCRIVVKDQKS